MKTKLSILLFALSIGANAQIIFQKVFNGAYPDYSGSAFQQTNDGGFILAGYTDAFAMTSGYFDAYLLKANTSGSIQWAKTFGGSMHDWGNCVIQTSNGGFAMAGHTGSFGSWEQIYLVRADANGTLLWSKTFGGSNNEFSYSILQTNDGGFLIAGYSISFNMGGYDAYLVKTDSVGGLQWTKTFGGSNTNNDWGYCIQKTIDGCFIMSGKTNSFTTGVSTEDYLMKINSSGNVMWSKTYGTTAFEEGYFVQQTADAGFIMTGSTGNVIGNCDVYLVKTDSNGSLLWSKSYGGTRDDRSYCVRQTPEGGYIIAGYTNSFNINNDKDIYLIKTDVTGNELWSKAFGGTNDDIGNAVILSPDGGYAVAGITNNFGYGYYLIKTDSDGNSACNQYSPITVTNAPMVTVISPATVVMSGGTSLSPATQTSSGQIVNTLCTTVGMEHFSTDNGLTIFPNPTSGHFTLQTSSQKGEITIYNLHGEKVFQSEIKNQKSEIDLSKQSSGIYFLQIKTSEGVAVKKIIINK